MDQYLNPTTFLILIIALTVAFILAVKMAKDPGFGVVLVVFFLPFERIPSLDIGGFTFKTNHFIGALTFLFLLLAIIFARRKLSPNPLTIPLLLMFFFFLLSGFQAENQFRHWTVYISLLIMLMLYFTTIHSLQSKEMLQLVVGALFLGAGLMSLIGLYQFFGDIAGLPVTLTGLDPGYTNAVFGFPRVHAFSKEPLYFANYLFIPLGTSLALFLAGQKIEDGKQKTESGLIAKLIDKLRGPWLVPLVILLMINFILTLSRGAFIAFVPFAITFAIFYAKRIFTIKNIILGVVVTAVSLTAVYNILESVSPDALDRFLAHARLEDVLVKRQGESGFGRLEAFTQALQAWETSLATGIGLGNFGPYINYYPLIKPERGWEIVNNEYLELLAETGVLGVASVLTLLVVIFARSLIAYRRAKDEYLKAVLIGLTAALVAIWAQYNFFSTFYIIHIWVLFGLIIGVQNLILKPRSLA